MYIGSQSPHGALQLALAQFSRLFSRRSFTGAFHALRVGRPLFGVSNSRGPSVGSSPGGQGSAAGSGELHRLELVATLVISSRVCSESQMSSTAARVAGGSCDDSMQSSIEGVEISRAAGGRGGRVVFGPSGSPR